MLFHYIYLTFVIHSFQLRDRGALRKYILNPIFFPCSFATKQMTGKNDLRKGVSANLLREKKTILIGVMA
jgi:hypothetical protein